MRTMLIAALLVLPALADETIVVTGHGEAKVRPDRLEFHFQVSAKAEKAADALTKIREKTEKVRAALLAAAKERKLEGAALSDSGLEFGSPANPEDPMMGGGGDGQAGEVLIRTLVTMRLDGVDKLKDPEIADHVAAIVDSAVAEGAAYFGGAGYDWDGSGLPPKTVAFELSDPSEGEGRAWDAAVKDARRRAVEIAKRFGREITEVVKIEDLTSANAAEVGVDMPAGPTGARKAVEFGGTGEETLTSDLKVEFRLK